MRRQLLPIGTIAFAFLTASSVLLFTTSAQADLVAHWNFEEGAGTMTRDQVTMRDDPLTDLTWVTDVPDGATGGFSLQFNGSTSVIDTGFEGIGGDTPRTILAWIRLEEVTDTAASQTIAAYGSRAGNGQKWHVRINDGGPPRVPGAIRTEAQGGNQTGTTNLADGLWHHVASVFPGGLDSNNTDVIHYVDGRLEGQTGTTDEPINTVIGPDVPSVSIGARRQSGNSPPDGPLSSFFNGLMYEVRMYDEALSLAEIKDIAGPLPPMQINGFATIDVNNTLRFEAAAENVVTGSVDNPAGALFAQRFEGGSTLTSIDAWRNNFDAPVSEGVITAPILWSSGRDTPQFYPEAFGFDPGSTNEDQYSVRVVGEMLIPTDVIRFRDGNDDYAGLLIDLDGDGDLDDEEPLIDDNAWTDENGDANPGAPVAEAVFTNLTGGDDWRKFEFFMAEQGGDDFGVLAWDYNDTNGSFPEGVGDVGAATHNVENGDDLVPASHLRFDGTVDDATVSFDAVLRLADVAESFAFDVNVEQLEWDKIGMSIPAQIGNNTPDSATLDLDGVTINVSLSEDPTPGLTVDLIDNRGITEIVGTPSFNFSHGDPADWDTSSFLVNGQLSFMGGGGMLQAGDYDGDGFVGQGDIDLVLLNWGNDVSGGPPAGWVTNLPGGNVDQDELDAVLLNWGSGSQGVGPAAVPEPGTLAMLLLAAAALAVCRGRNGKKLLAGTALVACLVGVSVQSSLAQIDIGGEGVIAKVFVTGEQQNTVEIAAPDNGLGLVFSERYSNPRPTFDNWLNVQDYVANNDPVSEGLIEAPPIWDNGNLGTYPYPPALGFPQSNQDNYGVRIYGEMLIPEDGGIDFRDGADDHTVFIIDEDGDGSLDNDLPIIEDTAWTSLDGTENQGGIGPGTFGLANFSNVEAGGSWRKFELTMSEGGGGDRLSLAWSVGDEDGSLSPAIPGVAQDGFNLNEGDDLVPGDHYRAPGAMILESFDSVLNYTSGATFDVNVEELEWDRVASNAHVTTAEVNYVVDFSGGELTLNLSSDPVPGMTVDLVDDSVNVDEIRGPASFAFSHGDPAMWDTSNFTTNGQITFGSGAVSQAGDYDGDGLVGQGDMDLVLLNWGLSGNDLPNGWVLSAPNGNIDQDELDAVLLNWGAGGLTTAGVPEPSTIVMLLIAAGLACGLIRRRR